MADAKRVILITGATRGLGRSLTDRFIEMGHTVVGCGRSTDQVQQLQQRYGPPHHFRVVDVADAQQVNRWAAEVLPTLGPPDLLLNNAAIINNPATLWSVPVEEFDRLVDINIKGVVHVIRAFVPAMLKRRRGVIVNFSSGWGRAASPEVAPYCASKFAVEGLTRALAQELPEGMAAIPLNPGVIDTDMLRQCWGSSASNYPDADRWSRAVAPWLLQLGPKDNGKPLTAPC
jgi:NAD(P)-dependent dehydrogenase (short-subunit alcohol dehydrogenase family)